MSFRTDTEKDMRTFIIVYVVDVTDVTLVCDDDICKEEHKLTNLLLHKINVSTTCKGF